MKELSIEEKAKAYDEALKVLHKYDGANIMFSQSLKEEMFPELTESEDERIRKSLLNYFGSFNGCDEWNDDYRFRDIVAWLEKHRYSEFDLKNEYWRGYDDAKMHMGEKQGEQKPIEKTAVYLPTLDKAIDLYYFSYGNGKGGFDNLSLEKFGDIVKTFVEDYGEQKPAWSEEDDEHFERILKELENQRQRPLNSPYLDKIESDYYWLKSLKDRCIPQPKQEWSEEDEFLRKTCIGAIQMCTCKTETKDKIINWLKSLRPQKQWKPSDEQIRAFEWAYKSSKIEEGSQYDIDCKDLLEQLKRLKS